MLLDGCMHCVRGKVQFAWPHHGAVFEPDLSKQSGVGKRSKNPGLGRMNQAGQFDRPRNAVRKCNAQSKLRKGFDFGDTPRRPGCNLVG
jgi:hypothetical protein